ERGGRVQSRLQPLPPHLRRDRRLNTPLRDASEQADQLRLRSEETGYVAVDFAQRRNVPENEIAGALQAVFRRRQPEPFEVRWKDEGRGVAVQAPQRGIRDRSDVDDVRFSHFAKGRLDPAMPFPLPARTE